MRTVIGYDKNRRPIYRDDGPAFARVQGHGGAQMGWFSGTVVIVQPPRVKLPRQPLSVTRPRKPKADPEARDRRST